MTGEMLILQVAAAFLLYVILKNRLVALAHPLRMRLADLGRDLLAEPSLDDASRARVQFQLDHAYNGYIAWAFVVSFPVAAVRSLIDSFTGKKNEDSSSFKSDLTAITTLATLSVFATSPIAAVLFIAEMAIFAVLWIPVGSALRYSEKFLATTEHSIMMMGDRVRHGH
jgi:hypothetical protein